MLLFLILAGPGLLWAGIVSLRRGYWRDSVPLLEVVIDRAAGLETHNHAAFEHVELVEKDYDACLLCQ